MAEAASLGHADVKRMTVGLRPHLSNHRGELSQHEVLGLDLPGGFTSKFAAV